MILLFNTSAGEHTVVATVPCNEPSSVSQRRPCTRYNGSTYRCKARREVAHDVILKILRLQQLGLEEIVGGKLRGVHENSTEDVGADAAGERGYALFADHLKNAAH